MYHLLVIEMVLHSLDFLIVLVAFTGNEDYIILFSQHTGGADGLATVGDADDLLHLFLVKSSEHVVDDVLRFLKARVIRCDDYAVALAHSLLCHQRPFAFVPVASGSAYRDDLSFLVEHFVNGIQDIGQCVRSVCIVDDGCIALRRTDWVESSVDTLQRTHGHQDVFGCFSQHDGSPIHGKKVRSDTPGYAP